MTGLSEQQLAEIAARAGHLYEYVPQTDEADQLAGTDAPALLAEIARLRGALSEATGYVAELEADLGGWGARVAELEAERHSTNEALSKAAEAIRAKDASVLRRALAKVTELRDRLKAAGDPDRKGVTAAACLISALADATEAGEEW